MILSAIANYNTIIDEHDVLFCCNMIHWLVRDFPLRSFRIDGEIDYISDHE
jgi:hypothetical protein